jgi:hypothetical protein
MNTYISASSRILTRGPDVRIVDHKRYKLCDKYLDTRYACKEGAHLVANSITAHSRLSTVVSILGRTYDHVTLRVINISFSNVTMNDYSHVLETQTGKRHLECCQHFKSERDNQQHCSPWRKINVSTYFSFDTACLKMSSTHVGYSNWDRATNIPPTTIPITNYWLTPWRRVLHVKLKLGWLENKLFACFETWLFVTLIWILSQSKPAGFRVNQDIMNPSILEVPQRWIGPLARSPTVHRTQHRTLWTCRNAYTGNDHRSTCPTE